MAGAIPVIALIALGIFSLLRLAPGDAATLLASEEATAEDIASLRAQLGLDQSVIAQFVSFLGRLASLDLGTSVRYQTDIGNLILQRLPATVELAGISLFLACVIGMALGLVAALHKGKAIDGIVSLLAVGGVSAPSFWIGILLVLLFSAELNLLPSSGRLPVDAALVNQTGFHLLDSLLQRDPASFRQALAHILLPAATLALGNIGLVARITRASVVEVSREDFIGTATAKGLSPFTIVSRHLMPNASVPIATIIGLELGSLISGSIIVEVIFSWPGIGTLLVQGINVRDTDLVVGIVIVYTFILVFINALIDIIYFVIDPRMRSL